MERREAVERLRELAGEIYEVLEEMRVIIRDVAPEQLKTAESYWMAHIDGALENRGGWLGKSFISFVDTIEAIEEEDE